MLELRWEAYKTDLDHKRLVNRLFYSMSLKRYKGRSYIIIDRDLNEMNDLGIEFHELTN